jgi:hypothetical protein
MYSFIFGFQRFVWCPKCTPASSKSFMAIGVKRPPYLSNLLLGTGATEVAPYRCVFPN